MRKHQIVFSILTLLLVPGCFNEDFSPVPEGRTTEWIFHPDLDQNEITTKSIGDASQIDQLRAAVYLETSEGLSLKSTVTESWSKVQKDGLSIRLDGENTYKLVFWAENKKNTAYNFNESGTISVDYSAYINGGFAKMEELDAFFHTTTISAETGDENTRKVVLKRPLAQLNFGDITAAKQGEDVAKVTFHSIPTAFDPFTGEVRSSDPIDASDDITFTFTDFVQEELNTDYNTLNYLSCNYLLAPTSSKAEAACTFELYRNDSVTSRLEFIGRKALVIEQRKKTNIDINATGKIEAYSEWNGKFPIASTLSRDPEDPDCYILDAAEDIAWLCDASHTAVIGENKTFRLVTNVDMGYNPGQMSMKLPEGSTFDGNGHTIKGLKLMNGLFGNTATRLTVNDLIIEGASITGTANITRGVLANTLYGSSSFNNVTVQNSYVSTAEGAAGGMIGYISRKSINDRGEPLDVVFNNCHVINTSIEGATKEGYFVGIFRGYDNGEQLKFMSNCSCIPAPKSTPMKSGYIDGNESVWLEANDYSAYDAWLGSEECYRGLVIFGNERFVPKWDGKTEVKPLLAEPKYDDSPEYPVTAGDKRLMIYSAYDLAGVRSKVSATPDALYFKEDVDLNGAGADGITGIPAEFSFSAKESTDDNYFKELTSVGYLDGQNHTIYNMNVKASKTSVAFIRGTSKKTPHTIHKNLKMYNCNSISEVKEYTDQEGVVQDLAVGAVFILRPSVNDTCAYTMQNIHIHNSRVFALQSVGILASQFMGKMENCSVNDCHVENWKCENNLEPFVHRAEIGGGFVTVSASFYSYGEVGGICGMVQGECDMSNCHVRRTTIRAWGQDDKEADITGEGILGSLAASTADGLGYFLVPGRHVSTLIGDVRTYRGETVRITGCTADDATTCYPRLYQHSLNAPDIGQAYFIKFMDTEGTVIVDGRTLTLADGNRNTKRN